MNETLIINTFLFLLIVLFFYGPWQYWVTSYVRQRMFETRDYLFLQAAEGKINFESDEYNILREFLNGSIRFAHKLTWFGFTFYASPLVTSEEVKNEVKNDIIASTINLIKNDELRNEMKCRFDDLAVLLIASLYMRSIFLISISFVVLPIMLMIRFFKRLDIKEKFRIKLETAVFNDMRYNPIPVNK